MASQVPAASAEAAKPFYTVKITGVSPASGILETPAGITSSSRVKKVSGLGTAYSADSTITVGISEAVDYTWTPKEYYPRLVSDSVGNSLGSAHDTQRMDETYYRITAVNTSEDEWVTDFTFTISVPSSEIGDAEAVYVMLSGSSPVSAKIKMYDGSTWKTIRTSKLDEGELVEFPVGEEYIQSGDVKVRVYTTDDSKYDVKIDYIAMKFKPETMLVKYTLPIGSKLASVRRCCSGSIDVTNKVSDRTVSVELSDYMDFEDRYYSIEYSYTYTLTLSDYSVVQKTILSLSSAETPQTEIEYLQSMRLSMPYPHKVTMEAEPTMSAITLKDLRIYDKGRAIKDEKGTQKIDMDETGAIRLAYNLKNAYSYKAEYLYNQTSRSLASPAWSSRYSLRRGYDAELVNVSIRHELIGDQNKTDVEIKPSTDWYMTREGRIIYLNFPSLKNDIIVTVREATAGLSVNYTQPLQVTNPVPAGTPPVFRIDVGFINPSERAVSYNISRKELLSLLPDIRKNYPDFADGPGDTLTADLKSREGATVRVYFNASAVLLSEGPVVQDTAVIGQPVQWRKVVRITNPGTLRYENVTWNVNISFEATDCMLDDGAEGKTGDGTFEYTDSAVEPGQKKEHVLIYSTSAVRKTEEIISTGIIEKKIEKRINLINNNDETVTLLAYTDIVPNFDVDALKKALPEYTLADKNGDGVNDIIKWKETLYPGENKSIVINGTTTDLLSGIGAIGSLGAGDLGADVGPVLPAALAALFALLLSAVFFIRYVRHERRHRMLFYISAIEGALKGKSTPSAAQKK
ncbi:MAG: hypothetical protein WAX07_03605 [Candidatus Altiarchaeia archaeon]